MSSGPAVGGRYVGVGNLVSAAIRVASPSQYRRGVGCPRGQGGDADLSVPAALRQLVASGHSRAPVVTGGGGLGDVVGVVRMRDLLDETGTVADRAVAARHRPETLGVTEAMRQMRQHRQQFALTVDERGAIDGIVTWMTSSRKSLVRSNDETDRDVYHQGTATTPPRSRYHCRQRSPGRRTGPVAVRRRIPLEFRSLPSPARDQPFLIFG